MQRQLILLTISLLTYLTIAGFLYAWIEDWYFDNALYWCVSTFTTIGFGDYRPRTDLGKSMLPIVSSIGIALFAAEIWSIRNLVLETFAVHLSTQYSRRLSTTRERRQSDPIGMSPRLRDHMNGPLRHSPTDELEGLDLPGPSMQPLRSRTLTVSRSNYLPQVKIVTTEMYEEQHLMELTRQILVTQIFVSGLTLIMLFMIAGLAFSSMEGWTFLEGLYFSYTTIVTIGYGDYVLKTHLARSIFIWFIFLAILVSTYLGSMVTELAMNQWTVTVDSIEKRVGRYETKALWKKQVHQEHSETSPLLIRQASEEPTQGTSVTVDYSPNSNLPFEWMRRISATSV
ncbi:hypothetical protein EDD86DRAFT_213688 [Gorgonomyces haynaldii]|nr:hypothetical protein EDD86DRAFT_213688 [Gorgonomyces haynaldii]